MFSYGLSKWVENDHKTYKKRTRIQKESLTDNRVIDINKTSNDITNVIFLPITVGLSTMELATLFCLSNKNWKIKKQNEINSDLYQKLKI